MDRRRFLVRLGGLAMGPALSSLLSGCVKMGVGAVTPTPIFTEPSWQTLEAVQAHLLPSEPGAPGAREIRAAKFLRGVLADPMLAPAERAFLIGGVEAVDKLAHDTTGKPFVELSHAERESVLRDFEQTAEGGRWLGEMLGYLMEALLGDPVYGGNPDGVGWDWLTHNPGFPRPPAAKRYFLL